MRRFRNVHTDRYQQNLSIADVVQISIGYGSTSSEEQTLENTKAIGRLAQFFVDHHLMTIDDLASLDMFNMSNYKEVI